jgi:hypothetical protein
MEIAVKSRFAYTLDLVRAYDGFQGFGFKKAAAEANTERTMMRYALEAFRNPALAAAIDAGTITDPKVVQAFHRLPAAAIQAICGLEARLGRKLSRARAEELVRAYFKVMGKPVAASKAPRAQPKSRTRDSRDRRIPMPRMPAVF